MLTPHELIMMLSDKMGPCGRFCAWCPDDINTAEVKECVEEMQRQLYVRDEVVNDLTKELIKIRKAYHTATGEEYKDENN